MKNMKNLKVVKLGEKLYQVNTKLKIKKGDMFVNLKDERQVEPFLCDCPPQAKNLALLRKIKMGYFVKIVANL